MQTDYSIPLSSFLYDESAKKNNISNLKTKFNGYVISTINIPKDKMYQTIIYSSDLDDPLNLNSYCIISHTGAAAFKEHLEALQKIYPANHSSKIWRCNGPDRRQLSISQI